jgi:dihydrofolate reductase
MPSKPPWQRRSAWRWRRYDPPVLPRRLVDEMHVSIVPILLGSGEHLFVDIGLPELGYLCTEHVATKNATHVVVTRRPF